MQAHSIRLVDFRVGNELDNEQGDELPQCNDMFEH